MFAIDWPKVSSSYRFQNSTPECSPNNSPKVNCGAIRLADDAANVRQTSREASQQNPEPFWKPHLSLPNPSKYQGIYTLFKGIDNSPRYIHLLKVCTPPKGTYTSPRYIHLPNVHTPPQCTYTSQRYIHLPKVYTPLKGIDTSPRYIHLPKVCTPPKGTYNSPRYIHLPKVLASPYGTYTSIYRLRVTGLGS